MTLNGTLEDYSPAGILRVLSSDGRTGAVRFDGEAGCTVYLHRGQLYFARDERTDGALATALVRPGRLTADDWARAIDGAGDRPMVGELLVRDVAIEPDLLASVVLSIVYDPLISLFRASDGDFEFEPDTVHWLGPFRAFPVEAIVTEVRRRVREADEWGRLMPTLDVWVDARRTLPGNSAQVTLLREDWELVTALVGPRTIDELAAELGRGRYSTARVVYRLSKAGLVDVIANTSEADVLPLRPSSWALDSERSDEDADGAATVRDDELGADLLRQPIGHPAGAAPALLPVRDPFDAGALFGGHDEQVDNDRAEDAWTDGAAPRHDDAGSPFDPWVIAPELGERPPAAHAVSDQPAAAVDAIAPGPPPAASSTAELPHRDPAADHTAGPVPASSSAPDVAPEADAEEVNPNTSGLEDLYAQFIDESDLSGKRRPRNDLNPVEIAFSTQEPEKDVKVSTLRRLLGALKNL